MACSHGASGLGVRAAARARAGAQGLGHFCSTEDPSPGSQGAPDPCGAGRDVLGAVSQPGAPSSPIPSFPFLRSCQTWFVACRLPAPTPTPSSLCLPQASPPNLFLALPSVLASASCRPQTGTVGHRGDSVKNRTAFYSRSIRLDPRTYEFKHE